MPREASRILALVVPTQDVFNATSIYSPEGCLRAIGTAFLEDTKCQEAQLRFEKVQTAKQCVNQTSTSARRHLDGLILCGNVCQSHESSSVGVGSTSTNGGPDRVSQAWPSTENEAPRGPREREDTGV